MHVDADGLSPEERAMLAALPRELPLPAAFEDRVAAAAVAALAAQRGRTRLGRALIAASVAALLFAAGWWTAGHRAASAPAAGERYLLVLREGPQFRPPATLSPADLVGEYSAWAKSLARKGRLELGEELADGGVVLGGQEGAPPPDGDGVIAGLFIVRASSEAQALEIGRSCPHLRYGGRVEVRRIIET